MIVPTSAFLVWMLLEVVADRFKYRRWPIDTPAFWAKALMVLSCSGTSLLTFLPFFISFAWLALGRRASGSAELCGGKFSRSTLF